MFGVVGPEISFFGGEREGDRESPDALRTCRSSSVPMCAQRTKKKESPDVLQSSKEGERESPDSLRSSKEGERESSDEEKESPDSLRSSKEGERKPGCTPKL